MSVSSFPCLYSSEIMVSFRETRIILHPLFPSSAVEFHISLHRWGGGGNAGEDPPVLKRAGSLMFTETFCFPSYVRLQL